jgi:hypothetical protein
MKKYTYIILAVICGFIGNVLRIVAYQNALDKGTPEWVYNIDSIAYTLETLWPYLLSIGVCKFLPRIKTLHLLKFPAVIYLYTASLDMLKELTGFYSTTSWHEVAFFCFMLLLILFYQTYAYLRDTNTDS